MDDDWGQENDSFMLCMEGFGGAMVKIQAGNNHEGYTSCKEQGVGSGGGIDINTLLWISVTIGFLNWKYS